METDLRKKVKSGLRWSFLNQLIIQVALIAFNIYLARILDPEVFGVVAMVTVFSNFAVFLVDAGFTTAIIQRQDTSHDHLSTVFWINIAIGAFLFLVFFLGSGPLSALYETPALQPVTQVTGLVFIFSSLGVVQNALLVKKLDFKTKSLINWVATLTAYVIGIILAMNGFGIWSIVVLNLAIVLINTALLWITSSWLPSFFFSWQRLKELSSVGSNVLGDTLVNYWSRNADNFLIGKYVGSEGLGIYSRAYTIMLLPIRNITAVLIRVLFPAFSTIQNDLAKIRSVYLKTIRYIAFITFPAMFGLAMLAPEFVVIFFGDQWLAMIPILQWLAVLGAFQSIISLNGVIYNSLGKANIAFRVSLVVNAVLIASFIIGLWIDGLMGLTIAYFIAGTILSVPVYYIAIRQIELKLVDAVKALTGPICAVLVMVTGIFLIKFFWTSHSNLPVFIVCVLAGAVLYVSTLFMVDGEFRRLIRTRKI
jgi:O-antigen/teichoic acid export membrane protein